MTLSIGILISGRHGRGSNMKAIIDACRQNKVQGQVSVVIGNFADSPALERAAELGVPAVTIPSPSKTSGSDAQYGLALAAELDRHNVGLVCLAGYIRKVPSELIARYPGRIMNIHNALIPAFCGKGMYGMHVHQAAIDYGVKLSGCTVHFVDDGYDTGPIILQSAIPVQDSDTAEDLSARVLVAEHDTYWRAIALFSENRLRIEGRKVRILPAG
jgi:formyltetrahydrofolate-dependent phosphoribosylglycinamide formyltransferase